jgi:hypothetical protein
MMSQHLDGCFRQILAYLDAHNSILLGKVCYNWNGKQLTACTTVSSTQGFQARQLDDVNILVKSEEVGGCFGDENDVQEVQRAIGPANTGGLGIDVG